MIRKVFAFVAALAAIVATSASAQQSALNADAFTQREAIWGASISPDGNYVAAIQSVDQGQALVIIDWRTRRAQAIQVARQDRQLFFDWVQWKDNNRLIFALRQRATITYDTVTGRRTRTGDGSQVEDYNVSRVFTINRDGSNTHQMFEGETSRLAFRDASIALVDTLPSDSEHILLATWTDRGFTLYRADINSGRVQSVEDADWNTSDMIVDREGTPVMRVDVLPYGSGWRIFRRAPGERRWTLAHEVRGSPGNQNRTFDPIGPGPGRGQVYVAARAEGEEFQKIYLYDTATGQLGQPLYGNDAVDAGVAWVDTNGTLLVGCALAQRISCRGLTPLMQRHFEALHAYFGDQADFTLQGTSADGNLWLILADGPTIPATYYMYDLTTAQIGIISSTQPRLPRASLSPTTIENYTARDGTALWAYVTAPQTPGPHPLVVMPHGGPEARDVWGYDNFVQYLVARGYTVVQPNFRGSDGSGRSFLRAGWAQWGRRMQDDVSDVVAHMIQTGAADAQHVCIVGISYGGYAALAGATLTPDLYQCSVSIAGLSDLIELLETERADTDRRSALYAHLQEMIGDPGRDRDALIAASPRRHVDAIRIPVLLIHGTLDEVALPDQSQRMYEAMQRAGKNVRYIPVEGADHPWTQWTTTQQRQLFIDVGDFLDQNIGPRAAH